MSKEPKISTPTVSPTEVAIDGKFYTLNQLRRYIRFYNTHQIERGQTSCPLCECDYEENDLFVCDECGDLFSIENQCEAHEHGSARLCKECCTQCAAQKAFEDAVNLEIDKKRGK